MPAQLLALSEGPDILLDKPILLLGRHQECDIQLNSRKVSRRHCCIAQVHTYLVVRDLGSTNGVRINGVRVLEGKLDPGDELTVGNFRYQVAWDDKPASAPPPVAKNAPLKPKNVGEIPRGKPVSKVTQIGTEEEEDILESCDDPVMLGQPKTPIRKPPAAPPPVFPDDVDLLADSRPPEEQ